MVSLKEIKVGGFRVKINDNNLVTNPPNNLDSVNVSGYSCIYGLTFNKLFEDKVLVRCDNEVYLIKHKILQSKILCFTRAVLKQN